MAFSRLCGATLCRSAPHRYFNLLSCAAFNGQPFVDWNNHHRKGRPSVIANLREQTPEFIAADHRVFVVRTEDHHVRVPMTNSRSEILISRPHVSKTNNISSWYVHF